ncbi:MAG TPA: tetratricopeptide repeat protein [Opitutaceae bacterium]|nr:tetratricopeptide repeat protein [Opitutaceae bacterium]
MQASRMLGFLAALLLSGVTVRANEPAGGPAAETPVHPIAAEAVSVPADAPASHEVAPVATPAAVLDLSEEAAGLLRLASSLTDRGDMAAAEIAYRQLITRSEFELATQKEALLGMAAMYRKQGLHTKSAAIFEKFLKEYPNDTKRPEVLLDLGRTLRAMGAHALAISRFYSVINSTLKIPGDGYAQYHLLARTAQFEIAETHFETGNYSDAGKFFGRLRLLELAPVDRARAHFMAGRAKQLSGDLDSAVQTFRAFLEQWPDAEQAAEAGYLLATTLRELNRSEEALVATHTLLRSASSRSAANPRLWSYWQRRTGNQLANDLFQSGNVLGALGLYEALSLLSEDPNWRIPVTYQIGLCHERLLDTERARRTYRAVVDGIGALGERATPELRETARMAAWRLDHMAWQQVTTKRLLTHFPPPSPKDDNDPARSTPDASRAD